MDTVGNFSLVCSQCGKAIVIHKEKIDNRGIYFSGINVDASNVDHDLCQIEIEITCECGNVAMI